jgi:hypothetical protein
MRSVRRHSDKPTDLPPQQACITVATKHSWRQKRNNAALSRRQSLCSFPRMRIHSVGWMMTWNRSRRMRSWPNWGNLPAFSSKDWESIANRSPQVGKPGSRLRSEPATSWILVECKGFRRWCTNTTGLCPLPGIINTRKRNVSETDSVWFRPQVRRDTSTPLERVNLNHWTNPISYTSLQRYR